jgi:hypothetical protein
VQTPCDSTPGEAEGRGNGKEYASEHDGEKVVCAKQVFSGQGSANVACTLSAVNCARRRVTGTTLFEFDEALYTYTDTGEGDG